MRRSYLLTAGMVLLISCGGGGGSNSGALISADAQTMVDKTDTQMVGLGPIVALIESNFVFLSNPNSPMAQGIVMQPDASPGAPANTFTFAGDFDGNGDGHKGTHITGRASFGTDPNAGWSTVSGEATMDISIPLIGPVYHGTIKFSATTTQRQLSGTGMATNPLTGATATIPVPDASPLVVKIATGAPGAVANACRYSLDGTVQLDYQRPTGTLKSNWNFSSNRATARTQNATFKDPSSGQETAVPDADVNLQCGSGGSINDWSAVFTQDWACLPIEHGQARLTITIASPDTITISDEDPPGSGDINTYAAQIVGVSPHTVSGYFIGGPAGNQYREDFTWTLAEDGSGFSQISTYTYFEGANNGITGICAATAKRVP